MRTSADPQPSSEPVLRVEGASVVYDDVVALDRASIVVERGSAIALIGPNGAGKSTLIRAVLGLEPLSAGTITVLGRAPERARDDVAYVPQADTLDRDFPVSAHQVVLMGRYRRIGWGRRPGAADRRAALEALDEVGLADRAGDRYGSLSGGQRQRVLLARAIAQQAALLLLDEPFNGLDTATSELLVGIIGAQRSRGVGIVMATHDLAIAHLTCSDACLLNRHQVSFGPIGEALAHEPLSQVYGPDVTSLMHDMTTPTMTTPTSTGGGAT